MHGLHRLGDASQRQGLASRNGLGRIEHRGGQGGWATTQMTAQQAHDAPFSPSVHPVVDGLLAEPAGVRQFGALILKKVHVFNSLSVS
jgi:hypothetical protein